MSTSEYLSNLCYNHSMNMKWTVTITNKARKQADKLPDDIKARFEFLLKRLREHGCFQPQCKRFGKLSETRFHCHIKEGKPTYVVV